MVRSIPSSGNENEPRTGILIPASIHEPVQLIEVGDGYEKAWRAGATRWALENPQAVLVTHAVDAMQAVEFNRRATVLAWIHNSDMYRQRQQVGGAALLVGPQEVDGDVSAAPEQLVNAIIPNGRLQMQFQDAQQGPWLVVGSDDDWYTAYEWMLQYLYRASRTTLKLRVRLVPTLSQGELEDVGGIARSRLQQESENPQVQGSIRVLSCTGIDDLAQQIRDGSLLAGDGFHWRDLCLLNLVDDGEHWLAIRRGYGVPVPPLSGLVEEGQFTELITRLLSATRRKLRAGRY
ncbi:hypothetical protein [Kineosporia babensis]|uniref:Uncharacterized protein n=1 Tax=Kineosporia babensis TaxID=499548 RepID=A0A9X1T4T8_9ACTN|nr:hypothetical protein [Kineosporia babensis]MCD5316978.1 hypothetical protein [Kineosporia babensis]